MAPLVDNAQIQSADLLRPLPLYQHAYIWPFAIIWPVFLRFYLSADLYDTYMGAQEWTFVWMGTIITAQSLVWLCTHWSVNLRAAFTAKSARSIDDAELIKVFPAANAGSADICKLVRDKVRPPLPPPPPPPRRAAPPPPLPPVPLKATRFLPDFTTSS
jgi:cation-transporting ATPase 13A1